MAGTALRLEGRVVLITGAANGIGRETARRAADDGADIAAIDIDQSGLDGLSTEIRALGRRVAACHADVSDADGLSKAIHDLAGELGPLHAVFANAGTLTYRSPISALDLDEWNRVLSVDLTGVMLTFRQSVSHIAERGGVLLACGSSLAIRPGTELLAYVAAKAGVHALCRSLALELAPRHIRVNVIAPGLADTAMTRNVDGHIERGLESVPHGRLVDVNDVAAIAVHLMTDDARSVTGSVFSVDAGRTAV